MAKAKWCFHFWHKWRCVKVDHYDDNSWQDEGVPSTDATYVCMKCNKARRQLFYSAGYLTVVQLNQAEFTKQDEHHPA